MWKKALFIILTLVVLCVAGLIIFLPQIATSQVYKALGDIDSVSFSTMEIDLVDGHIRVHDLYLDDTTGNLNNRKVHLELEAFRVEGIELRKMLFTRVFEADTILLKNGTLTLNNQGIAIDKEPQSKRRRISKSLLIHHVVVDSFMTKIPLDTTLSRAPAEALVHLKLDTFNISIANFNESTFKHGQLRLDSVKFPFKDQVGRLEANSIQWNSDKRIMKIIALGMRQNIKPRKYARHFKFDKAHIEFDVDSVVIPHTLDDIFAYDQGVDLQRILIYHPVCKIFKDKRLPHPSAHQKFPFEALADVDFPVQIDTISVQKGRLYFKETERKDGATAKLNLTSINADFLNVTSLGPNELGDWTTITGRIVFYHRLSLLFNWKFDLRKGGKAFVFDAKIGKAPLSILNPFFMNKANAEFKSGELLGGDFIAEGNKVNGEGRLNFYYKNLRLNMYNKEDHKETWGSAIKAGAANVFIRNNNLKHKNPHLGISFAEPQKDRFVIVYLWRLLGGGMQDIMVGSGNRKKANQRKTEYID